MKLVKSLSFLLWINLLVTIQAQAQHINNKKNEIIEVATFKGQQVTGVSISAKGRLFVNFPRWRKGVANSVIEITEDKKQISYPDKEWNSWEIGLPIKQQQFVAVQSVLAHKGKLYVLDTRNPKFQKVLDAPRVFVFDLETNIHLKTYIFTNGSYKQNSYINDLRVDTAKNKIYFTDSGVSGLVVLNMISGTSTRILDQHYSTKAEQNYLTFGTKKWKNTVHSDGIALSNDKTKLFYHALTAYSLYSIDTDQLTTNPEKSVVFETKTAAPDGMIFDNSGNLYFADLEHHKIQYRKPNGSICTLAESDQIKWADTFSIYNGYLYFTNSRIHEVEESVANMTFSLNKIKLP
ncbi:L-dopachrome tautomerase-related protein [Aquimarina agarivorans]|uniref:L-dopachrome tautomerase-related protein n=1 Tax=Aquimarina agarivorans TaxID=980584 RepID=UPI000248E868|nr:L-dopachrome tautomerase-related protein [Aquimarina agarivorans]